MKQFCENIPFNLAKKLKEAKYDEKCLDYYHENGKRGFLPYIDWNEHENHFSAPTYANVLDWLIDKGVFVQLLPYFTFATVTHFAYSYIINFFNEEDAKLNKIEYGDFASFFLCLNDAINKALDIILNKTE